MTVVRGGKPLGCTLGWLVEEPAARCILGLVVWRGLAPHLSRAGASGQWEQCRPGQPRPAPPDVFAGTWPLPVPGP